MNIELILKPKTIIRLSLVLTQDYIYLEVV